MTGEPRESDGADREPDEHIRFAAYLVQLDQVAEADEIDLVCHVLSDPDRTMAQSAVVRHVDRRAEDLHPGPAYEAWVWAMAQAAGDRPFLIRRLEEWSLFRAVRLGLHWDADDLLGASDWLQLKTAAMSDVVTPSGTAVPSATPAASGTPAASAAAFEVLAEGGRTRRIRNTATGSLRLGRVTGRRC
ncbi:hypothetical protein ACFXAW_01575 [Streptomyces sp. NPDC059445]|uniref:hypothetical protein n=1 Tax=Streptomyces sp. NPDC059445 TaxID=3346832 RepID=UPI0036BD5E6E